MAQAEHSLPFEIPTFCGHEDSRSESYDVTDKAEALDVTDEEDDAETEDTKDDLSIPDHVNTTKCYLPGQRIPFEVIELSRPPIPPKPVTVADLLDPGIVEKKLRFSEPLVIACPHSPTDKARYRKAVARRKLLDEARACLPRTSYYGSRRSGSGVDNLVAINRIVGLSKKISLQMKAKNGEGGGGSVEHGSEG